MKVTALKEQIKNPDRVSVFVDTKYSFSLTMSEVIDLKIRVGLACDTADIEAFKKMSTDGKLRARVYEWLMGRPHSTRELRDYLRRKKTDPDVVQKLIDEFTAKHILDDQRFGEWFSERAQRKSKSKRMVQNELRAKGIDSAAAKSIAEGSADDTASLEVLLAKLAGRARYADQARLIRYLQGKGFAYGDIKAALNLREPEQTP